MATYSVEVEASWNGKPITEMRSLSINGPTGPSEARDFFWVKNSGSVSITYLGSGPGTGMWGRYADLVIKGGGLDWNQRAVCGQTTCSANLNGVTEYTVEFSFLT
jgi:hypothetical protein